MPKRPTPTESAITRRILDNLRKRYGKPSGWWRKKHGGAYGVVGDPDIHGCLLGRFVGIEVKRPGQVPTKIQARTLKDLADAEAVSIVATSWEDVEKVLTERFPNHGRGKRPSRPSRPGE